METQRIIDSNTALYSSIDECIDAIIKARLNKDEEGEGKALFRMEGLMVTTQQQLLYINSVLEREEQFRQSCQPRQREHEISIIECRLSEEQARVAEDVSRKMTNAIIKQLDKEK